jgi:hypothetical protein|tara:strand:+ start:763 stop:936 length:174 start_codon:yes stop_codon:yes gene_type:complete
MTSYQLYPDDPIFGSSKIVKKTANDGTVWSIPFDPDNTDYQEYLSWLAEGNTPKAAD